MDAIMTNAIEEAKTIHTCLGHIKTQPEKDVYVDTIVDMCAGCPMDYDFLYYISEIAVLYEHICILNCIYRLYNICTSTHVPYLFNLAVVNGSFKSVVFLVETWFPTYCVFEKQKMLSKALTNVVVHNRLQIAKYLVAHGMDIAIHDYFAIRNASIYGRLELLTFFISISKSIPANIYNESLLQSCIWSRFDIAKILIEKGAVLVDEQVFVEEEAVYGLENEVYKSACEFADWCTQIVQFEQRIKAKKEKQAQLKLHCWMVSKLYQIRSRSCNTLLTHNLYKL